ncbi:MAG: cadherin-like beta sandwich domain-containing protein, partial [Bacilli bacterium]|nr:cadherin-like beta sandwich domain-containing protein [Bacilli bacterium]
DMIKSFYSKEVIKLKKIINLFILTFAIFLIGNISVNAASLTFDGDKSITGGSTGSNDIIITLGTEKIKKVEFTVGSTDSSIVSLSLTKNLSLAGNISLNKSSLELNTDGYFTTGTVLATLKITNNSTTNTSTTIKITNVVFYDENDNIINGVDYSKDINLNQATTKVKSKNANLTNLSVSSGTLSPAFNASISNYKVINLRDTIKSVTINTTCDRCNVTIRCESGCTNYNNQIKPELIIGKNILSISTTSEDGSDNKEYNLIIYRGETTDNSAFLQNLEVTDFILNEKFDTKILDYTLTVPNDTTSLNILATPEDENAKVEIKNSEDLMVGENVVTITITSAETKDKKIYNITITRLDVDEVMVTTTPAVIETTNKSNKTLLIIIISIISLVIIATAGYFIFRKKKNRGNPEIITDEKEIEKNNGNTEIEIKENDLIADLNITDSKTKPSVDEALADLMNTKEIILNEE